MSQPRKLTEEQRTALNALEQRLNIQLLNDFGWIRLREDKKPYATVMKSDLMEELIKLQSLISESIRQLRKYNPIEADILKIASERKFDYPQPSVGDPCRGDTHFYDNPANAGLEEPQS